MKKNFIRGFIVLITVVAVFLLCNKVLMIKSEDGIDQMQSFYLQKDNTVDVLLVGSSHIYCNVNTGLLWDNYGISAFDIGGAEQPYWNSYYYIKEALKTQKPKVIVMSVTIPGIRFDDYQSEAWLYTNLYGMHWNRNRIDATKVSTLPQSFWRILVPMNKIHGRYNDITRTDFVNPNKSIAYKGFDYRATTVPFERPDITNVTDMTPTTEKQEEYLRKIISLTKEENIPLLLVSVPYVVSEDAQKIYNYEFAIAEETNTDYIDFNKCYDDYNIDFETDMAEELHLNISGSEKFTNYLGQCLKDRYALEDHRGDTIYKSWDEDALIHRMEINSAKLQYTQDINEYLRNIDNDNYIAYFDFENIGDLSGIDSEVVGSLNSLGISNEYIINGSSIILNNNNLLYSSSANEFSSFIDEGIDKILFKREFENDEYKTMLYMNTDCYELDKSGINILIYDRITNQLESYIVYYPASNIISRYI